MEKLTDRIITERLLIRPMTDAELQHLISETTDADLAKAYTEMLDGALKFPDSRLWYTAWMLSPKEDPETPIGDLCFKGPQQKGGVEIGYGMKEGYEGHGFMTEAVKALTGWAFDQKGVRRIFAETVPENRASQRILEKLGFRPCEGAEAMGEEGPRFYLEKEDKNDQAR